MKLINSFFISVLVIFFITIISISSCKKDRGENVVVQGEYKKNVLIEEISGEWCPSCPNGAEIFESIISANDDVFGVSIHNGDPFQLENPDVYSFLDKQFGVLYLPFAFFDRNYNEMVSWNEQTNNALKQKSDVGVGIKTSFNGDMLDVSVEISSSKNFENTHLTVYLVEDKVPESSPGAQAGFNGNYIHRHLLRKAITNDIGDFAPLNADKTFIRKYKGIKIGKYKKENLQIIAFVHHNVTGGYKVINTNGVKVGESVSW